jgi:hypothetical protein
MEQTLHQCPECEGKGHTSPGFLQLRDEDECRNCLGSGWLDENGEPFFLEPEIPECANSNSTTKSPDNSSRN